MCISQQGLGHINWWLENLENPRKIRREDPEIEIFIDASHKGWGAHTSG